MAERGVQAMPIIWWCKRLELTATTAHSGTVSAPADNAASTELHSVPAYFAMASTRPIARIVDGKTAAIYELGLAWLQLSPSGAIDPKSLARFNAGLVDLRKRNGLYAQDEAGVKVSEQVLYQARIRLPSNVQTGTYLGEDDIERLEDVYGRSDAVAAVAAH